MTPRHAALLPEIPDTPKPTARDKGRAWHGGSQFPGVSDFRTIDRNDRFRVWVAAQGFERRTHTKGKHGGALGHAAMAVLRALLFDFLNMTTGRLDPTYETIAEATNLARDTVIEAVKRLQIAGILEITRRIIRERVKQWCELVGRVVWIDRVRQTSNAYRINFPLPARRELGDLGAPLLRRAGVVGSLKDRAESESRTETTPVSLSKRQTDPLEAITDPGLRASLERMRAAIDARG